MSQVFSGQNCVMLLCYFLLLGFTQVISSSSPQDVHFDYFVFSQQWPTSVCLGINISHPHPHNCKFGKDITAWSIHGLWPSIPNNTTYPSHCDSKHPFNMELIKPILGELEEYWVNLFADTSLDSLWKHEWEKHGTCASSVAGLQDEFHYFNTTLGLHQRYNIYSMLSKHGIKPRKTTYRYTDVLKAMGNNTGLYCYYDKTIKVQYLAQVEMCLSKSLQIIDCKSLKVAARAGHDISRRSVSRHNELDGPRRVRESYPARLSPCYDTESISYPEIHH